MEILIISLKHVAQEDLERKKKLINLPLDDEVSWLKWVKEVTYVCHISLKLFSYQAFLTDHIT